MEPTVKVVTEGISPKAYFPAIGQVVAGIVLIIVGLDVEGKTLISSGIATFLVAWRAKAGKVKMIEIPAKVV